MDRHAQKIRRVTSRGTPSFQLGHYEMYKASNGKRRSVFKVDVHLGEHESVDAALSAWPQEIQHLRSVGRDTKADKLQTKLARLEEWE